MVLLEYNRETSQKTVGQKLTQAFNSLFGTNYSVDKVYDVIEEADPHPKNEYVQHIIRWILTGPAKEIEFSFLKNLDLFVKTFQKDLKIYDDAKKRNLLKGSEKDVTKFKTMFDFFNFIEKDVTSRLEQKEKEKQKKISAVKDNAEIIHESENYRCILLKTEEAACYYGKDTRWCTAATKSENYFDSYNKTHYIVVLNPKKPNIKKFQIGIERDYEINFDHYNKFQAIMSSSDLFLVFDKNDVPYETNYESLVKENIFDEIMACVKVLEPRLYSQYMSRLKEYLEITQNFSKYVQKCLISNDYTDAANAIQTYITEIGLTNLQKKYEKIILKKFNLRKLDDQILFILQVFISNSFNSFVGYEDTKKIQHWLKNIKKFIDSYDKCIFFIREDYIFTKSKLSDNIIFGFWVFHFNKPTWDENDESHLQDIVFENKNPKRNPHYVVVKSNVSDRRTASFGIQINFNAKLLESNEIYQDIFEQKNKIVINTSSITLSEIANLLKRNKKIIQESYLPPTSLVIEVNGKSIVFDVAAPHFQEIVEALEKYVEINI